MATTLVTICLDTDTKNQMEQVCKELGMTMATAFTLFAKRLVCEKHIPFEVSIDPFYSEENIAHLKRSIAALDAGHGSMQDN